MLPVLPTVLPVLHSLCNRCHFYSSPLHLSPHLDLFFARFIAPNFLACNSAESLVTAINKFKWENVKRKMEMGKCKMKICRVQEITRCNSHGTNPPPPPPWLCYPLRFPYRFNLKSSSAFILTRHPPLPSLTLAIRILPWLI